ncbi:MAG TPA: hypothetical protein VHD33_06695, partial [Legionellaceae bacterium]|nr:hypothetical protein [Legionellaceae bacterium]
MTESTENTHSSTNFLNQDEISFLLNYPLGLRLTDNSGEITQGNTRGDAVPLAHLAGGADTIEFITLSAYMANPRNTNCSNIPHIRQRLEALYNAYTNYQTDKNLRRLNLKYLPKLMIHYAQLSHIGDAEDAYELENTAVLPQSELDVLLDIYQKLQGKGVLTLELVFDKNLSYYEALPI